MDFVICVNCGKTMPKQTSGIELLDDMQPAMVWCSQFCCDEWNEKQKNKAGKMNPEEIGNLSIIEGMENETRVVHCKKEPFDVLIDRTTIYGNPFAIGKDGDRTLVCEKYGRWLEEWLLYGNEIQIGKFNNRVVCESLKSLRGKILGCWCKPQQCHGDTLVKLIEELCLEVKKDGS